MKIFYTLMLLLAAPCMASEVLNDDPGYHTPDEEKKKPECPPTPGKYSPLKKKNFKPNKITKQTKTTQNKTSQEWLKAFDYLHEKTPETPYNQLSKEEQLERNKEKMKRIGELFIKSLAKHPYRIEFLRKKKEEEEKNKNLTKN